MPGTNADRPPAAGSSAWTGLSSAWTERTSLLNPDGQHRRESMAEYATRVPEDHGPVLQEEQKHYNLVGLTMGNFWILCLSMWSCAFLSAFDGTIVAILVAPISSSFNATNLGSWLGTSYLLSVCCFTPIYGRLCNIIGRQASMLLALSFFSLGNVLCAIAPSMNFLIAARAIAGIGGGGLTSVGSTIMSDLVPISHRGIFQGYGNIMFGLGSGLGAPVGGIVSDHLGWRWAFYIQIPFLLIAGAAIFHYVRYEAHSNPGSGSSTPTHRETVRDKLRRIDFLGSFLLAGFMGSALVALTLVTSTTTGEGGFKWSDPLIIGLLCSGAVLFLVFMFVELKVAAEPILPVELLTQRTPVFIAINNLVISILAFGVMYSVPLYFQAVRLMSGTDAGKHLIPNSVLGSIGSLFVGYVVRHTGKYYWLTAFCGFWAVFSSVLLSRWDLHTSEFMMWTNFAPLAFAMGSVTTLTIVGLIADIGREHVAVATSLSYMFRTTGQVLGVALSGALTQAVLQRELESRITGKHAAKIIAHIRESSDSIRSLPPKLQLAATSSYQRALQSVFMCAIVLSTIGLIAALGMREVDLDGPAKRGDESDEEQT